MVNAVNNSQSQPTQQKKQGSVVIPAVIGGAAGVGGTYFTPWGKKPVHDSAEGLIGCKDMADEVKEIKGKDGDVLVLTKAKEAADKAVSSKIETLYGKDGKAEPLASAVLKEVDSSYTFENIQDALKDDGADAKSIKAKKDQLTKIKDAVKDSNEATVKIGDVEYKVVKNAEGKITYSDTKAPAAEAPKAAPAAESSKVVAENACSSLEAKDTVKKVQETKAEAIENDGVKYTVTRDANGQNVTKAVAEEAPKSAPVAKNKKMTRADRKAAKKASQQAQALAAKSPAAKLSQAVDAPVVKVPVASFSQVSPLASGKFASVEANPQMSNVPYSVVETAKPAESPSVVRTSAHSVEVHPVQSADKFMSLDLNQKAVGYSSIPYSVESKDTAPASKSKVDAKITAPEAAAQSAKPAAPAPAPAAPEMKTLEALQKEIDDAEKALKSKVDVADKLGIKADTKADFKVAKENAEKLLGSVSANITEEIKTAFKNIQDLLPKKAAWSAIAIGGLASAAVVGIAAKMMGGSKE